MKNLRLGQCFLFDSSVSRLTRALADMDAPAQAGSLFVFVGLWPYCASAVPALSQETEHRAHASDFLIRAARERTLSHVFSFFPSPRTRFPIDSIQSCALNDSVRPGQRQGGAYSFQSKAYASTRPRAFFCFSKFQADFLAS